MSKIISFSIIGTIGFIVDSSIFLLLFPHFSVAPSRVMSFGSAVMVTFLLNRQFTFKYQKKINNHWIQETRILFKYLSGQIIGFISNIIIFTLIMIHTNWSAFYPIIPLAFSSIAALLINYSLAKYAFTPRKPQRNNC